MRPLCLTPERDLAQSDLEKKRNGGGLGAVRSLCLNPEPVLAQSDLEKKRNDEETEEGWVQCDHCERWVHQICGLFNKGRNDDDMPYICPMCLLDGARPLPDLAAALSVIVSAQKASGQ